MSTVTKAELLHPEQRFIPAMQEQAGQQSKRSTLVMMTSLALTALVTGLAFMLVRSQENVALEARFHLDSADRVRAIEREMQLNFELMQSLVSFYAASEVVTREEFERFLAAPIARHPWIQSLQWAPRVARRQRFHFEQTNRAEQSADYQITEQDERGSLVPAGDREEYFPVSYMIPFQPNQRAHGFDLWSQPDRRQALRAARDEGEMKATAEVPLVQGERGFLVVAPVYQSNPSPASRELRQAALAGFCVGVFRVRALVEHALRSVRPDDVDLALFDVTEATGPTLLDFQSATVQPSQAPAAMPAATHGWQHRVALNAAGRSWLIVCTPSPAHRAAFTRWQSWSTLSGGTVLTAFLGLCFLQHRRYSDSLEGRVSRRTRELARAYRELEDEVGIRSRAEKTLRQSQEQLQAILNNTTAVVYVKDPQGRYLLVNHRYKWLFGVSDAGVIGRTDREIFPAEIAETLRANDLRVLATATPLEMEEVVPHRGLPHTYISTKFPLRDEQGAAYAVCGISTDITERKRMEEALKASQERYDLIITGINDGIWDWNLTTNEVYFSPHWKSMLGYAEHEVKNTFSAWQELLHPDDAERSTLTIRNFLEGRRPVYELEHRLRHRDGTYRWILARGVVLRDASGQPVRLAGTHVDLTERKKTEEQLRQANSALAERQQQLTNALADLERTHAELQSTQLQLIQAEKLESIGKLAAGVAHEVKNPLQTMLMGLTYLEGKLSHTGEDVKRTCTDMREAISRANSIVRGLLQMSGTPELDMTLEDVNIILEKALGLVNYSLNANRITAVRHLAPNLPCVLLDQGKVEQVFINLLTNSIHALPKGGTIQVSTFTGTDSRVIVQIQDNGPGIPPEHLARLFTPFFTTKQKGLGTGLGLSVTKSIVELHGGHIALVNAPEGGARATVTLPAAKEITHEKSTHTLRR